MIGKIDNFLNDVMALFEFSQDNSYQCARVGKVVRFVVRRRGMPI